MKPKQYAEWIELGDVRYEVRLTPKRIVLKNPDPNPRGRRSWMAGRSEFVYEKGADPWTSRWGPGPELRRLGVHAGMPRIPLDGSVNASPLLRSILDATARAAERAKERAEVEARNSKVRQRLKTTERQASEALLEYAANFRGTEHTRDGKLSGLAIAYRDALKARREGP